MKLGCLFALAAIALPSALYGQTLRGTLRDATSRAPVADAAVELRTSGGSLVGHTVSDSAGVFVMEAPHGGLFLVQVESPGYASIPGQFVQLTEGQETTLQLELRVQPAYRLEPLEATAQRVVLELAEKGFYDRRERNIGFFLGPEDLEKRPPVNEVEAITRAPLVYPVTRADTEPEGYGFKMRSLGERERGEARGPDWCDPILIVDGNEVPRNGRVEEFVNFADIVALEVYRGWQEVPPGLALSSPFRPESSCGVVMVWTSLSIRGAGGRPGG